MSKEAIISALKNNPHKNIVEVSEMLGMNPKAVAEAQIKYYKPFIPTNNPLWGPPNGPVRINEYVPVGQRKIKINNN